jgi:hypothetical protein
MTQLTERLSLFWARHRPSRVPGRWRHGPAATQVHNWRSARTIARGRVPYWQRATAAAGSRTPVYRSRINRATGRPHRDDAMMRRSGDQALARTRDRHTPRPRRVGGRGGR